MFFHGYVSHNQMVYVFLFEWGTTNSWMVSWKIHQWRTGGSPMTWKTWKPPYGDGLNMVTIGYINSLSRWISVVLHSWHSKDIGFGISDCRLEVTGGSALENMEFPTASKLSKQIHRFPIDLLEICYRFPTDFRCPWILLEFPVESSPFCRMLQALPRPSSSLAGPQQDHDVVTVSL